MRCPSCGEDNPKETLFFCIACATSVRRRLRYGGPSLGPLLHGLRFAPDSRGGGAMIAAQTTSPSEALATSFAAGRYHVKKFLCEGGKKMVYLAHDELLHRNVTFALIQTEGLDEGGRTRISREAQAMGLLGTHPHIGAVEHAMQRQVVINKNGHV